jgi:hypothetical protein
MSEKWDGYPLKVKIKGDVFVLRGKARPDGERGLYVHPETKQWILVSADMKKVVKVAAGGGGFPPGSWIWAPREGRTGRTKQTEAQRERATAPEPPSIRASGGGRVFAPIEQSLEQLNKCADGDCKLEDRPLRADDGHYHSRGNIMSGLPEMICCRHAPADSLVCDPNRVIVTHGRKQIEAIDKTRKRRRTTIHD